MQTRHAQVAQHTAAEVQKCCKHLTNAPWCPKEKYESVNGVCGAQLDTRVVRVIKALDIFGPGHFLWTCLPRTH